jgi:hypothetical protein
MTHSTLLTLIAFLLSNVATAQPADIVLGNSAGVRAVVRVQQGGRLASLQLRSHELLTIPDSEAGQFTWGNSCWTVPQSVWSWPPPIAHDEAPYQLTSQTSNSLQLTGPTDSKTGFRLTKTYTLHPQDSSLTVGCTYTNDSKQARWLAPWEISRSPKGGVVLVQIASIRKNMNFLYAPTRRPDSLTTYLIPPHTLGKGGVKINLDAAADRNGRTWLGYARDGYLLMKHFTDVPAARLAPDEGDAEIYVSQQFDYLELEETGPYQLVQPGQSVTFEVRWSVRKLPTDWTASSPYPLR